MLWLLVYASLVSVLMLVTSEMQYNNFQFLYKHWRMTARHVFWDSGLNVAMVLQQKNIKQLGNVNVTYMVNTIKQQHLNYISQTNTIEFNN